VFPLAAVEPRFVNPQLGDLDTVLPTADEALRSGPMGVVVYNIGATYRVFVRSQGSDYIGRRFNGAVIVYPGESVLF
jgi:hypothetical protein